MKAVICCINSKYIHSSLAPWCLLSGVRAYCGEKICAHVAEGTINENRQDIISRLAATKTDVIGFCVYIWNVETVSAVAQELKKLMPRLKIVFGGPEVSYNAKEILTKYNFVDFVISGEGERTFAFLLNALNNDCDLSNIDGLCYRQDSEIIVTEPYTPCEEPVSPYCEAYFQSLNGRIAYIETSRGCPYSCAFCLSGRCGGVRFFDIEKAKQNIIKLAQSGTKTVKFVDRTFNANRERAKEIISFIIQNYSQAIPDGVCFHFEIAGDILDDETINLLSAAPKGSIQLEIGLQSFNEKTLEYINRRTDTKKLKTNIARLMEKRNIHIHIDLIAGLPFEDLSSFADSFNIAFSLRPDMLQLGFLKLLHGAPMREEPLRYPCDFSEKPPYEVISTQWLSAQDKAKLHLVEDALERIYNSHRFGRTVEYAVEASEMTPFEFFLRFGEKYGVGDNTRLDEFTQRLYKFIGEQENIDLRVLRDKMVLDRLSTNPSGTLPECLKIYDKRLKSIKNSLNRLYERDTRSKRAVAILYSVNSVVFTDYKLKDRVTGEFELNMIKLDDALKGLE